LKVILIVTAWVVLNRGFHLDGLADTADALLSHRSVEEKLAILKDCHLGTFGVVAIVLDLLLKLTLLEVALASPKALTVLILIPVWGKLTISIVTSLSQYARPSGGLAKSFVVGAGPKEAGLAMVSALLIGLIGGFLGLATMLFAIVLGVVLAIVWRKAIGGVTGDLLGASAEIGEIAGLIFWLLLI
jgi:adenosylcobinamide-GDP ribazoletransferase